MYNLTPHRVGNDAPFLGANMLSQRRAGVAQNFGCQIHVDIMMYIYVYMYIYIDYE